MPRACIIGIAVATLFLLPGPHPELGHWQDLILCSHQAVQRRLVLSLDLVPVPVLPLETSGCDSIALVLRYRFGPRAPRRRNQVKDSGPLI